MDLQSHVLTETHLQLGPHDHGENQSTQKPWSDAVDYAELQPETSEQPRNSVSPQMRFDEAMKARLLDGGLLHLSSPWTDPGADQQPLRRASAPHLTSPVVNESPTSLDSYEDLENPFTAIGAHVVPFSDREAELMRNFSENMALWVCSFTRITPYS
jgi:hypothetical protein